MSQLISTEQLEASLDQDITLCSFAQAFEDDVMYGAILYNMKHSIYKCVAGKEVVVRANSAEVACDFYNNYHATAMWRVERNKRNKGERHELCSDL